jgi:hydrogenase expression/formation protein HypC
MEINMCIAAPLKIVKIDPTGTTAVGVLGSNELTIDIRLVSPQIGDYVLVHAGCAIELLEKDTAAEIQDIYTELEDLVSSPGH